MAEPTTSAAAAGAILWKLLPGAIGSLIALGFIGEGLTRKQKVVSFLSGGAVAYYGGPLIVAWFAITDSGAQQAIGFLVGLFGLAITKELFKEINTADIIGALKRRFLGGQ
ncbi:holin [Burkholderia cenocepacia]|uniref:Holin n=1 Tax=Burkholderia cenocepacia TaxID=95486 RepID=A0ABD4UST0_9BURK|nr:holin [Burkholderia cenocepacia]MCW3701471.1 holin [Burkholderia cenocepacia]MCW3704636.1 holin [Burkholderia cenocepacia]MCW3717480.1 holin [Burkholderia cenocepacia]MCW3720544.1 holin [Burkholderia cenocepacia]MCW3720590.1 holin [Burkholderia cenocepacia]